jgi:hypothetical protein
MVALTPHGEPTLTKVQDQAKRYMEAAYGKSVWYRAPETFDNAVERWIRALAEGNFDTAEATMTTIEQAAAVQPGGRLRA